MLQAFLSVAKAGFGPAHWLNSHSDVWPLVLPVLQTRTLLSLGEDESWNSVAKELRAVTESSMLGKRLFTFAALKVVEESVQAAIEASSKELLALSAISPDALQKVKAVGLEQLKGLVSIDDLPDRREVTVQYRGWPIVLKVSCVAEQLDWALMSALRGEAAAAKSIPWLPAEEWLCPTCDGSKHATISDELLAKPKAVRELLTALVNAGDEKTGEGMQDTTKIAYEIHRHFSVRCLTVQVYNKRLRPGNALLQLKNTTLLFQNPYTAGNPCRQLFRRGDLEASP